MTKMTTNEATVGCIAVLVAPFVWALAAALTALPIWPVWNYLVVPLAGVEPMTWPMAWLAGLAVAVLHKICK